MGSVFRRNVAEQPQALTADQKLDQILGVARNTDRVVENMKTDIAGVKSEISGVKSEVQELRERVTTLENSRGGGGTGSATGGMATTAHQSASTISYPNPSSKSSQHYAEWIKVLGWCEWEEALDKPAEGVIGKGLTREDLTPLEAILRENLPAALKPGVMPMRLKGHKNHCAFFDIQGPHGVEIAGIWNSLFQNPQNRLAFAGKVLRARAQERPERVMRQRAMGTLQDFLKTRVQNTCEMKSDWGSIFRIKARHLGQDESSWKQIGHVQPAGTILWSSSEVLSRYTTLTSVDEAQKGLAEFHRL